MDGKANTCGIACGFGSQTIKQDIGVWLQARERNAHWRQARKPERAPGELHSRPVDVRPQVVPVPVTGGGAVALRSAAVHEERRAFGQTHGLSALVDGALTSQRVEQDEAVLVAARCGKPATCIEVAHLAAVVRLSELGRAWRGDDPSTAVLDIHRVGKHGAAS